MLRSFLVLGVCAASAVGQAKGPVPQSKRVLVDGVIATVNDAPILITELDTLVVGRVREREGREGKMSPQAREKLETEELEKLLNKHRMAQAAKTFGDIPPEQVEQILSREMARERQAQEREFGTSAGFSRELARQGRTFASYEQDLRVDHLASVAEELAVHRRLNRQTNLLVTPRMLRDTYAANRGYFVRPAMAMVAQVRFSGADAQKNAEAAAAGWRKEDLHARQVASKFGGVFIPEIRASSLAPEMAAIATFALAGPQNAVSEPIPFRDTFFVARVTQFDAGQNADFEDPEVQTRLRRICEATVHDEFRQDAWKRAKQRTEVWLSTMPR